MSRNRPIEIPYLTPKGVQFGRRLQILVHEHKEIISHYLRLHRVWQRQLSVFIETALNPGDLFVDVGANIGYFSMIGAMAVGPSGRVHAFEPDPDNFQLLNSNRQINNFENIICHQLALGRQTGESTLHLEPTNRGAHSLMSGKSTGDSVPIKVRRLDEVLQDEPLPPRLVKIDVQGLDLAVLDGMSGLLAKQSMRPVIVMEFSPLDIGEDEEALGLLQELTEQRSYKLCAFICNDRRNPVPPEIDFSILRSLWHKFLQCDEKGAEFDIALIPAETRIDWDW